MREGVSSLCVGEMVCCYEYYIFNSEYSGLLTKIYFLTCDIIFLLCRPRLCHSTTRQDPLVSAVDVNQLQPAVLSC